MVEAALQRAPRAGGGGPRAELITFPGVHPAQGGGQQPLTVATGEWRSGSSTPPVLTQLEGSATVPLLAGQAPPWLRCKIMHYADANAAAC
jgi:hypothetical protein